MRDEQQAAVYAWEDKWRHWNLDVESPNVVSHWMRQSERAYRVLPVRAIRFPKNNRGRKIDRRSGKRLKLPTQYHPDEHFIEIRPRHRNTPVGLHEIAHAIHDCHFGVHATDAVQPHGPLWLGIYLKLLIGAKIAPKEALLTSAKAAGLKWAPLAKIHPGAIRWHYRGLIRKGWPDGPSRLLGRPGSRPSRSKGRR